MQALERTTLAKGLPRRTSPVVDWISGILDSIFITNVFSDLARPSSLSGVPLLDNIHSDEVSGRRAALKDFAGGSWGLERDVVQTRAYFGYFPQMRNSSFGKYPVIFGNSQEVKIGLLAKKLSTAERNEPPSFFWNG